LFISSALTFITYTMRGKFRFWTHLKLSSLYRGYPQMGLEIRWKMRMIKTLF